MNRLVQLKDKMGNNIYPISYPQPKVFLDSSRLLASFSANGTYTATEDCYFAILRSSGLEIKIDNVSMNIPTNAEYKLGMFLLKKDQTIEWILQTHTERYVSISVFGVK